LKVFQTKHWLKLLVFFVSLALGLNAWGDENLPLPPEEFRQLLKVGEFQILSDKKTEHGVGGARKLSVTFSNRSQPLEVKWRVGNKVTGERWNNSPRREVAAYQFQKLFLDPPDYVVPPVASRCIPFSVYRPIDAKAVSNLNSEVKCVFGTLTAWLQNVEMPKILYDPQRFEQDKRYAYHLGNLALLNYLIQHRDAMLDNYLISKNPQNPRMFSIDNSFTFKWEWHNIFQTHWHKIRIPALPRKSIERLRKISDADLERLAVLEQLEMDENGVYRHVEPGEKIYPCDGNRFRFKTLQLGLTCVEINNLKNRLAKLLKEVDAGKWPLF